MADLVHGEPVPIPELFDHVDHALQECGYRFDALRSQNTFRGPFAGDPINYEVLILIGPGYVTVIAQAPLVLDPSKLKDAASRLNELSVVLPLGSYEIVPSARLLQFKIGLPALDRPAIRNIGWAVTTASGYLSKVIPEALGWLQNPGTSVT
jgi:hypothetical protein